MITIYFSIRSTEGDVFRLDSDYLRTILTFLRQKKYTFAVFTLIVIEAIDIDKDKDITCSKSDFCWISISFGITGNSPSHSSCILYPMTEYKLVIIGGERVGKGKGQQEEILYTKSIRDNFQHFIIIFGLKIRFLLFPRAPSQSSTFKTISWLSTSQP